MIEKSSDLFSEFEREKLHSFFNDILINEKEIAFDEFGCLISIWTDKKSEHGVKKRVKLVISKTKKTDKFYFPLDILIHSPQKTHSYLANKLGYNTILNAKDCVFSLVTKHDAMLFFEDHHLFKPISASVFHGLYFENQLVMLASYSEGRSMRRLPEGKLSYEMIQLCSKQGYTISGGLSKLVKMFGKTSNAGDLMCYVDAQFSEGEAFIKAGFELHSQTNSLKFAVHKTNYSREIFKPRKQAFYGNDYYISENLGNLKMVFNYLNSKSHD